MSIDGPVFGEGPKTTAFTVHSDNGNFDLAQLKVVACTVEKGRVLNANEQLQVEKIAGRAYEELIQREVTALVQEEQAVDVPAPREPERKHEAAVSKPRPKPKRTPAEHRKIAKKRVEGSGQGKHIAVAIAKKEVAFASVKERKFKAEESRYKVDCDLPEKGADVAFASVRDGASDKVAAQYLLEKKGPEIAAVEHEGEKYPLATP